MIFLPKILSCIHPGSPAGASGVIQSPAPADQALIPRGGAGTSGLVRADGTSRRSGMASFMTSKRSKADQLAFDSELNTWLAEADDGERAAREIAADAIREVRRKKGSFLELANLTSLPSCLSQLTSLKKLSVVNSNIPVIADLPPKLIHLDATGIQLHDLRAVPPSVWWMDVTSNALRALPPLPPALSFLFVQDNQLIELTPHGAPLPASLRMLNASRNRLTSVPPVPPSLGELRVDDNQLTSLPQLPPRMDIVSARNNQLRSLSSLPEKLRRLHLSNNQLTDLPGSLMTSPFVAIADLQGNLFSNEVLERMDREIRQPELRTLEMQGTLPGQPLTPAEQRELYVSGLVLVTVLSANAWSHRRGFTGAPAGVVTAGAGGEGNISLAHAVLAWFPHDGDEAAAYALRQEKWTALEANGSGPEDQEAAVPFTQFLTRLQETAEYQSEETRPELIERVTLLLDKLADDAELRSHVYAHALDALGTCSDRIAFGLDNMELSALSFGARRGAIGRDELATLGTGFFKLTILSEICIEEDRSGYARDHLELQLALRTALAGPLNLPVNTRSMRYFPADEIGQSQLQQTTKYVTGLASDRDALADYLIKWEPWREHIDQCAMPGKAVALATLESDRSAMHDRLAQLMRVLETHQTELGELSTAALDTQAQIAGLRDMYEKLEAKHLDPVRHRFTLAYLNGSI